MICTILKVQILERDTLTQLAYIRPQPKTTHAESEVHSELLEYREKITEIRESKVKTQSRQQEPKCKGASGINLHTSIFLSIEQQKDAGTIV